MGKCPHSLPVNYLPPWWFWTIQFCSNFTSIWSKYLSNNIWRYLNRLSMSTPENQFWSKFAIKNLLYVLLLPMLTLELICIWTTYWWNLNKIIWFKMYKKRAFWQKKKVFSKPLIWQSIEAILEDVSVAETTV